MEPIKTERVFNKTQGETIKLLCTFCKHETTHEVLQSVDYISEDDYDNAESNFQIIECMTCNIASFRRRDFYSGDYCLISEDEWEDGSSEELFPKRGYLHKSYPNLPSKISRIYNETISSLNEGNLLLCGLGVRLLVEAICLDQGIPDEGGLFSKLKKLPEFSTLTKEQVEILTIHRHIGNDVAHSILESPREDLIQSIEILEYILEYLYVQPLKEVLLKAKGERLLKQRQERKEALSKRDEFFNYIAKNS